MSDIPTNKLSVYLIKSEYSEHKDILKEIDKLKSSKIDDVGTFYYGESHTFKPSWLGKFFGTSLSDTEDLFNASSKGILLISASTDSGKNRIFAIPFGYGWTLLNPGVWEERFGLKVVLNILDSGSLRRIDKKNMSSVPKDTSEQLSRAGVAADFGIDFEQDLIRSITGKTKVEQFGKTITGKDAINVAAKVDLSSIKDFLKECYEKYESDDYKENFGWVDQISDIRDPKVIETLNGKLVQNIKDQNFDKTWMAVPELVDWSDVKGFVYKKNSEDYEDDIHLPDFLSSLSEDEKNDLDLDILKRKKVYCFSASSDELKHQWKAYDCLYCEIQDDEKKKTYLLSNGNWYEVEKDFANQINSDYKQVHDGNPLLELPVYKHKNENDYNEKVAEQNQDFCCMDRKNIKHGGGYSKIEFCDLITKDKKIVHVKRYGGSAVLSHLFSQGVVSGELFIADEDFRKKVNEKLSESHKIANITERPTASEYQVIFAIISSSDSDLEVPFFSKVSLRNAKRRLETYGYKVALQKIKVEKEDED